MPSTRTNKIVHYTWGLGKVSNNLAEAYFVWCGLSIAKGESIQSLTIFGDSMLVIKVMIVMIAQSYSVGNKLIILISRIKRELSSFEKVSFLYIKLDLNSEVDYWAKFVIDLSPRTLLKMGI